MTMEIEGNTNTGGDRDEEMEEAFAEEANTEEQQVLSPEPPPEPAAFTMEERESTQPMFHSDDIPADTSGEWDVSQQQQQQPAETTTTTPTPPAVAAASPRGRAPIRDIVDPPLPTRCLNPASDINSRLDTQVEVKVYPCNNSQSGGKKKSASFTIKPEGVVIQGSNRNRNSTTDLGADYATHVGRKLQRYELADTRACQLLVTTHGKSFWVVPAPEAFSRHSGTCRLLGDRKHPPAPHTLQVGDFLRVGSVGVVVIETHDGVENRVLSEEKIQKIMKDTTSSNGGFLDLAETDGGELV